MFNIKSIIIHIGLNHVYGYNNPVATGNSKILIDKIYIIVVYE